MTEQDLAMDRFERQYRAALEAARRRREERFDPRQLAWLALPPGWTGRLAREAGFPGWEDTSFLARAEREGVCQRRESPGAELPSWYAVEVGVRLAPYLPPGSLGPLLAEVAGISEAQARSRLLVRLVPELPPALLPEALDHARAIQDLGARAQAILGVATVLPDGEARERAVTAALTAAEGVRDPGDRAEALLVVAPSISGRDGERLGRDVLATLPELAYESERSRVLARVAPHLPEHQLPAALEVSQELRAVDCRIDALASLTRRLPAERAVALLREEIGGIATLEGETVRARAARILAKALAERGAVDLATTAADSLRHEPDRAMALGAVAARLVAAGNPSEAAVAAGAAMAAVASGEDDVEDVKSLSGVAHHLAREGESSPAVDVANRARDSAESLDIIPPNAPALASLASAIVQTGADGATETIEKALRSAEQVGEAGDRFDLYHRLAQVLPEPTRSRAAARALEAAREIRDVTDRVDALVALVPVLDEGDRWSVVEEARSLAAAAEDDFSFWMPEPVRTGVLDNLSQSRGQSFLYEQTTEIGTQVARIRNPNVPVSPAMARWAELATQGTRHAAEAAEWLDQKLKRLAKAEESGEALAWVETAKLLVPAMGQELDSVVSVGTRRVELLYRRSLDLRHLRRFLPRNEQIEAFQRLLEDKANWALHYIGVGGVGKTMLLRHVTASLAPQLGVPTARVDFDHLSPDYPIRMPGQLLLELIDELQSFSGSRRHDSVAHSFKSLVKELHDAAVDAGPADLLANLDSESFVEVMAAFRDFLLLLPQPVVLILDTCEELAKFRSEGVALPSLEATFKILERLHGELPETKVIFAGRRPLARSGSGWEISGKAANEGHRQLPERKSYLRLHEIRGFDPGEAERFLDRTVGRKLPDQLRTAILERSPEAVSETNIAWSPARPDDKVRRHNPFDLNLYGNWVRQDPELSPTTIWSGTTDPYISIRIVRRLRRADLEDLLPAVVLLGRFDRSMLRVVFSGSEEEFEEAYRELSVQEWIGYQPDQSLNTTFLEVDRNLRPRLIDYYRKSEDPARLRALDTTQEELGRGLAELVRGRLPEEFDTIGIDLLDASMRLLPRDGAALLWHEVAEQLSAQGKWPWADERTNRLLGEDGAVAAPDHPARAAVLASRIASLIHTRSAYDPMAEWQQVHDRADADPDPVMRAWLRHRACAGRVAAYQLRGIELSADDLAAFWELLERFPALPGRPPSELVEQLAATCVAALEGLVEVGELLGDPSLVSEVELVERWVDQLEGMASEELTGFAEVVLARSLALHGRFAEATERAFFAQVRVADLPARQQQRWADWEAPVSTLDRLRLELARSDWSYRLPGQDPLESDQLRVWQEQAEQRLDTIDGERLVSAILTRRLASGPVPEDEVRRLTVREGEQERGRGESLRAPRRCHLAVARLFVSLVRCWLALGRADLALELLDDRRRRARKEGDSATEGAAELATLEVSRRIRLAQPGLTQRTAGSKDLATQATAWALMALTEPVGGQPDELPIDQLHQRWRTRPAPVDPARDLEVLRAVEASFADSGRPDAHERLALTLDAREAAELVHGRSPPDHTVDLERVARRERAPAEQLLRAMLRMDALGVPWTLGQDNVDDVRGPWILQAGIRRMAELALDEGELLALRLPARARPLLDRAADWFRLAGDPAGALFASVAAALAGIRAGGSELPDLDRRIVALGDFYEQVRATLPQLPASPELGKSLEFEPSGSGNQPLGGWLLRLATSLQVLRGVLEGATLERSSVRIAFRLETYHGLSLPAELELARPARPTRSEATPALPPVSRRAARSILAVLGALTMLIGFVTGLLAFGLFTFRGVEAALEGNVFWITGFALVGVFALLLVSIWRGYIDRIVARIRSWWWSRAGLELRIDAKGATTALLRGETQVKIWSRQRDPSVLLLFSRTRDFSDDGTLPPLRSYRRSAAALPGELQARLGFLARRLDRSGRLPVALRVDPLLDRLPWEALLTLPFLSSTASSPGPFDFWRQGDPVPLRRPPRTRSAPRKTLVLADHHHFLLAERGWRQDPTALAFGDVPPPATFTTLGFQIVHVVGKPVRSRDRVLLQLVEQLSARGASEGELLSAVVGSELLEPEDVADLGPWLVVVQGVPVEASGRLDTERRDAADLRSWAADVFRAGAAAVISLPSTHPELAEELLGVLGRRIQGRIGDTTLLDGVRAARALANRWTAPKPATEPVPGDGGADERRLELALDICLFERRWTPLTAPIPEHS